jgi:hypothetical protein
LLGLLARSARDAIVPSVRAILDRHDVTPGLVVSIQTFGSYAANFHPHVHALVTDGAFTEEGEFRQLPYFDARLVEEVFRRRVLERLHRAERLARYLTRGPLLIDVVEKVEGGRLRVRTPPDPRTGLVEKILDPLDLIHALTTQIPDPGQHLVRYYAWYSNRSRGARGSEMKIVSGINEPDVIDAIPSRGAHRRRLETTPPGDVTDTA